MNVCVIGAGPAGLTAIRQLLAEGHSVQCFEKDNDIGGVFRKGNSYDSLLLTISNYFMAYSDFMPFSERLKFWTGREYEDYLHRYAEHYGLMESIAFDTQVIAVTRKGDGWLVTVVSEGETSEQVFDAVAVCSGHFQQPNIPNIDGLDGFTGRVMHAIEYKNPQPFEDRRVLCIGMGETSSDVTSEISTVARECTLSLRRYQAIAQRYIPFQRDPYFTIDTSYTTSRTMNVFSHRLYRWFLMGVRRHVVKTRRPDIKLHSKWLREAGSFTSQVLTKNARIFEYIVDGKVGCNMAGIACFKGNQVFFKDGESREIDDVVLCTGFKLSFPFLDNAIDNTRNLYKQMFLPEIGRSLAFIGFARPLQGGVPVIAEMQSRYFALLCSGKATLPSAENMVRQAKEDRQYWEKQFHITPHVSSLVNYCQYMDDMAGLAKCTPVIPAFISDPVFYTKIYLGPQFAIQYRLNGDHSRHKEAYDFIRSFPVIHSLPQIALILLAFWLSRIIPVSVLKPRPIPKTV